MGTNLLNDELIVQLAEKHQKTPVQIVLNWNLSRGVVVIPKASGKEHQEENLGAKGWTLA